MSNKSLTGLVFYFSPVAQSPVIGPEFAGWQIQNCVKSSISNLKICLSIALNMYFEPLKIKGYKTDVSFRSEAKFVPIKVKT